MERSIKLIMLLIDAVEYSGVPSEEYHLHNLPG